MRSPSYASCIRTSCSRWWTAPGSTYDADDPVWGDEGKQPPQRYFAIIDADEPPGFEAGSCRKHGLLDIGGEELMRWIRDAAQGQADHHPRAVAQRLKCSQPIVPRRCRVTSRERDRRLSPRTPEEGQWQARTDRTLAARQAALTRWALEDPVAGTAPARSKGPGQLEYWFPTVDPDNVLPPAERAKRAERCQARGRHRVGEEVRGGSS